MYKTQVTEEIKRLGYVKASKIAGLMVYKKFVQVTTAVPQKLFEFRLSEKKEARSHPQ